MTPQNAPSPSWEPSAQDCRWLRSMHIDPAVPSTLLASSMLRTLTERASWIESTRDLQSAVPGDAAQCAHYRERLREEEEHHACTRSTARAQVAAVTASLDEARRKAECWRLGFVLAMLLLVGAAVVEGCR